jgi:hypothetical protein
MSDHMPILVDNLKYNVSLNINVEEDDLSDAKNPTVSRVYVCCGVRCFFPASACVCLMLPVFLLVCIALASART